MTSILCATLVQAAILATGVEATQVSLETYAEAHKVTTETGKPMVVMVSTDWCPPCQTMKKTIIPRVKEHGALKKVAFAVVNPDRDRPLAEMLTGGGPIPQLVMFRKTEDGWMRRKLIGGQSVEAVEEFIADGLEKYKAEKDKEEVSTKGEEKVSLPADKTTAQRDDSDDDGKTPSRRG